MAVFELDGVMLSVPDTALGVKLEQALESGRYERQEIRALSMHLRPEDRVLDLGAGVGLLSLHAARVVGSDRVVAVEANPELLAFIATNLASNGLSPVRIEHGAVMVSPRRKQVPFFVGRAFWDASLTPRGRPEEHAVDVPALGFAELTETHKPTVLTVDLEGGELDLVAAPMAACIRLIVLDLHPRQYGVAGVKRVFDALSAAGFGYQPAGSRGQVLVFERVPG